MHSALGEDDARLRRILDGVLALAVLAGDAADCTGQVVAFEDLHIGDHKGVDEEIFDAQKGYRIANFEAEQVGFHKVSRFLQRVEIIRVGAGFDLNAAVSWVHAHIELEMLDNRRIDLHPVLAQRCVSIRRHLHAPELSLAASRLLLKAQEVGFDDALSCPAALLLAAAPLRPWAPLSSMCSSRADDEPAAAVPLFSAERLDIPAVVVPVQ